MLCALSCTAIRLGWAQDSPLLRTYTSMRTGGEVDCRGCYTAMATLHLLRIDPKTVMERAGMVDFISRCQVWALRGRDTPMT